MRLDCLHLLMPSVLMQEQEDIGPALDEFLAERCDSPGRDAKRRVYRTTVADLHEAFIDWAEENDRNDHFLPVTEFGKHLKKALGRTGWRVRRVIGRGTVKAGYLNLRLK